MIQAFHRALQMCILGDMYLTSNPSRKRVSLTHQFHGQQCCHITKPASTQKNKKRKDHIYRRQFNEKPNFTQGCPDRFHLTLNTYLPDMSLHVDYNPHGDIKW